MAFDARLHGQASVRTPGPVRSRTPPSRPDSPRRRFCDAGTVRPRPIAGLPGHPTAGRSGTQFPHGNSSGDVATVSVVDNGPGIPDERKRRVFGKGEKGLDSEGTGIGLYLVDTLVEGYGGSVRILDNEPRGTVVVVELPLAE